MSLAPSGYWFFRNVLDFNATGNGVTDDAAAINRAVAQVSKDVSPGQRCGQKCGSTTTQGAVDYFPVNSRLNQPFDVSTDAI